MATSFPSFPLLPKELRLAIWKLALEPRIVELCFEVADEEDKKGNEREGEGHNEKLGNEEHGNANEEEDQRDESEDEGGTRDRQHDDVSLDIANPDREAGIEDADNTSETSETSEPTYSRAFAPGQFYSPSPLPSLLRVNSEARSVALAAALKGFPVPANQEDVYYNPEIDILYFPAGCWQEDITGFEQAISGDVKGSIKRIALGESCILFLVLPVLPTWTARIRRVHLAFVMFFALKSILEFLF